MHGSLLPDDGLSCYPLEEDGGRACCPSLGQHLNGDPGQSSRLEYYQHVLSLALWGPKNNNNRYSDQQRSKSRQKVCDSTNNGTDQYQNGSSNKPLYSIYIESSLDLLALLSVVAYPRPAFSATNKADKLRSKFLKATHQKKKKNVQK